MSDAFLSRIATVARAARGKLGLTIRQAALRSQISITYLSQIENGKCQCVPRLVPLRRLELTLGLPAGTLTHDRPATQRELALAVTSKDSRVALLTDQQVADEYNRRNGTTYSEKYIYLLRRGAERKIATAIAELAPGYSPRACMPATNNPLNAKQLTLLNIARAQLRAKDKDRYDEAWWQTHMRNGGATKGENGRYSSKTLLNSHFDRLVARLEEDGFRDRMPGRGDRYWRDRFANRSKYVSPEQIDFIRKQYALFVTLGGKFSLPDLVRQHSGREKPLEQLTPAEAYKLVERLKSNIKAKPQRTLF